MRHPIVKQRTHLIYLSIIGVLLLGIIVFMSQSHLHNVSAVEQAVGKLMYLPTDETPTIATVEDKAKLHDESLRKVAANGDEMMVYVQHKMIILYRPRDNKIVTVLPATIDAAQAQAAKATIVILNGTTDAEIVDEIKQQLARQYPDATVTVGAANRTDYQMTIVIDNNSAKDDLTVQIIDTLKAKRGVVPVGEAALTSDVEIIIGQDVLKSHRL